MFGTFGGMGMGIGSGTTFAISYALEKAFHTERTAMRGHSRVVATITIPIVYGGGGGYGTRARLTRLCCTHTLSA